MYFASDMTPILFHNSYQTSDIQGTDNPLADALYRLGVPHLETAHENHLPLVNLQL